MLFYERTIKLGAVMTDEVTAILEDFEKAGIVERTGEMPRKGRDGLAATRTEHIGSAALNLCFPRGNLIGMYVELLGKLRQCPIALDGGKRHLRFEGRCVIPPRSSLHGLS
jgi:hypothetical protein